MTEAAKTPTPKKKQATRKRTPKTRYLSQDASWTPELLEKYYDEIERIAIDQFGLDVYPNQLEIITSEQMENLAEALPGTKRPDSHRVSFSLSSNS